MVNKSDGMGKLAECGCVVAWKILRILGEYDKA